jgi:outer membrane immunogenic protein
VNYAQDPGIFQGFGVNGAASPLALSNSLHPRGGLGGVQGGYNLQTGPWVVGFVADFDYRRARGKMSPAVLDIFGDSLTYSTNQDWFGTVRGRIGISPTNSWLLYATGGLAYGKVDHSITQTDATIGGPVPRSFSGGATKAGWTVGGGAEYALSKNWSIGAEYLYVDLGSDTVATGPNGAAIAGVPIGAFPSTRASFKDTSSIARLTLSYKLN